MNPDHIETWRNYFAGQLHERCGVAKQQAQKTAARWLRSLEQRHGASETQQILEVAHIRNRRHQSRRSVHARLSATQTRATGAQD
jgi:hypothetical protein